MAFTIVIYDDQDIKRQLRSLIYRRSNVLTRVFSMCYPDVNPQLFQSYCTTFYCIQLWAAFTKRQYSTMGVAYNNALRCLFNFNRNTCTGIQEFYCPRTHKWVWSTGDKSSNVYIIISVVCCYCFTFIIIYLQNTLTNLASFFSLDISPIKVIYINIVLGFFQ